MPTLEFIEQIARENIESITWASAALNVAAAVFVYFYNKSYQKKFERLKRSLEYDFKLRYEQKSKRYQSKLERYQAYFDLLNSMNESWLEEEIAEAETRRKALAEKFQKTIKEGDMENFMSLYAEFFTDSPGFLRSAEQVEKLMKATESIRLVSDDQLVGKIDEYNSTLLEGTEILVGLSAMPLPEALFFDMYTADVGSQTSAHSGISEPSEMGEMRRNLECERDRLFSRGEAVNKKLESLRFDIKELMRIELQQEQRISDSSNG